MTDLVISLEGIHDEEDRGRFRMDCTWSDASPVPDSGPHLRTIWQGGNGALNKGRHPRWMRHPLQHHIVCAGRDDKRRKQPINAQIVG